MIAGSEGRFVIGKIQEISQAPSHSDKVGV